MNLESVGGKHWAMHRKDGSVLVVGLGTECNPRTGSSIG
jgi:hypothetical protein